MKSIELLDYEIDDLIASLREAMHMHKRMQQCEDLELRQWHYRQEHKIVHLLEAIKPKQHCDGVSIWEATTLFH